MAFVIAVSGTMGSGKSTLVEHLSAALPNCCVLFEDDYHSTPDLSLAEMESWWQQGASVGQFDLSRLVDAIRQQDGDLGAASRADTAWGPRRSLSVVLLETQFGRLHNALAALIDFQIWVDVPLDICMVRKVAQYATQMRRQAALEPPGCGLQWIEEFCRGYLTTTRKFFEMQRQQVRARSDVTIDGTGTPLDVCSRCLNVLPERFRADQG